MTETMQTAKLIEHASLPEFSEGCDCPKHGTAHKKTYTFGSTMSAETSVCVFYGCKCAVAVRHDPVGTYDSSATYHTSYDNATGVGRLHAAMASAKYR